MPVSPLHRVGEIETGEVWEQTVLIECQGRPLKIRRVVVRLNQPTRDGDTEIAILTNLPETVADSFLVASLYRGRWTVETFFQVVTINFNCEIKTLGYPQAALFSFAMALFAYNALSLLITALSSVHGVGKIEAGLSNYYLAEEITMTYFRHDDCHSCGTLVYFLPDENPAILVNITRFSRSSPIVSFCLTSSRSQEEEEKASLRPKTSSRFHSSTNGEEKEVLLSSNLSKDLHK
jgi:hypothetical protein